MYAGNVYDTSSVEARELCDKGLAKIVESDDKLEEYVAPQSAESENASERHTSSVR
jgi:hypothetical protein